MISLGLVKNTQSLNPAADAFQARTKQIQDTRKMDQDAARAESDRRDQDMLRVFELAGDGFTEEAKTYAQSKGINVPPDVYANSVLAKGLAMSGKIYPGDPAAAQKFTQAFMSVDGDLNARISAGQQAAGTPVNPEDRMLERQIALRKWDRDNAATEQMTPYQAEMLKLRREEMALGREMTPYQAAQIDLERKRMEQGGDGFNLSPGQVRYSADGRMVASVPEQDTGEYDAYEKAYSAALSGLASPEEADAAGQNAVRVYNEMRGRGGQGSPSAAPSPSRISTGLIDPMAASNAAIQQRQSEIGTNRNQTPDRLPENMVTQPIPPGLPPGTIYEGTSNGYPVYRDPAGNRYIDDGAP